MIKIKSFRETTWPWPGVHFGRFSSPLPKAPCAKTKKQYGNKMAPEICNQEQMCVPVPALEHFPGTDRNVLFGMSSMKTVEP